MPECIWQCASPGKSASASWFYVHRKLKENFHPNADYFGKHCLPFRTSPTHLLRERTRKVIIKQFPVFQRTGKILTAASRQAINFYYVVNTARYLEPDDDGALQPPHRSSDEPCRIHQKKTFNSTTLPLPSTVPAPAVSHFPWRPANWDLSQYN